MMKSLMVGRDNSRRATVGSRAPTPRGHLLGWGTRAAWSVRLWGVMPTTPSQRLSDNLPNGLTMPRFLVSAYGPSLLASFGFGAVIPMLVVQATQLGAGVGLAAFIAALVGIGQVIGDLPAGAVADRFGERRALVGACLIDAVVTGAAFFTHNLAVFGLLVFAHGVVGAVFALARQTYLTVAVPLRWRARAMSSLGGVFRVGAFLGPLAGAVVIAHFGLPSVFLLSSAMSLAAAFVTLGMPDTPATQSQPGPVQAEQADAEHHVSVWSVLKAHRHTLLTIGWGMLAVMLVRSARQTLIPLWCQNQGFDPTVTNLIYSASMGIEVLLFFPGGVIMDRLGRWWVTVPTLAIMTVGFATLPLTHSVWVVTAIGVLLGFGNGLSSGIVMTLGADLSPEVGRPQFLAGWRVFSDVGTSIGPLVISLVTVIASLGVSAVALALIGAVGAAQLGHLLPRSGQLPPSQPRPPGTKLASYE